MPGIRIEFPRSVVKQPRRAWRKRLLQAENDRLDALERLDHALRENVSLRRELEDAQRMMADLRGRDTYRVVQAWQELRSALIGIGIHP